MEDQHSQAAQAIQQTWVNKDYLILKDALSENIKWYERSYDEPLTTYEAIVEQWKKDLAHQTDIKVTIDMLSLQDKKGTYQFDASFKDMGTNQQMDLVGVFYVELDDADKISLFKQWWMPKNT